MVFFSGLLIMLLSNRLVQICRQHTPTKDLYFTYRYRPEIPEPALSLSQHGVPLWGIQGGSQDQNNPDLSDCGLSVKISMCETSHGARRLWTHFVCVCLCMSGLQNFKYPQLELHGWRGHYTGWYTSSGSLFYICDFIPKLHFHQYRSTKHILHTQASQPVSPSCI